MAIKLAQAAVQTLTASGTAQAVSTLRTRSLILQADTANTGNVYIGGADVDSTNGLVLEAGKSVVLNPPEEDKIVAANEIYWDGTTGDKLRVIYEVFDLA